MTQVAAQPITFDQFLQQYPEDGGRYELLNGAIAEMRPIGQHEEVARFIADQITLEIYRLNLPYFVPRTCLVKPYRESFGYLPDIAVLDQETIATDPYWQKYSTISMGSSARLVVEVVSTNWRDDYLMKLADYENLAIPEYWIVDYRASGAARYIGSPKLPTLSVYRLSEDNEYQVEQFQAEELRSGVFPEWSLTAQQMMNARR
jgi:Uma2 family endonuclease